MDNAIELKEIHKSFKNNNILKNVNLLIPKGSTVGIIGYNGSGKSVLFKLICGFERADQGEVFVNGEKIGEKKDFPDNIGVLINNPGYIELYSGFQNLKFLAEINHKIDDIKIKETMELVGLDPQDKTKVKNYSLGMKQKLGIAQAIMEDQDIIILDEPFNSLDFKTYEEFKRTILQLQEQKKTILITSHNYRDLEELCMDIYVLDDQTLHSFTNEMKGRYFKND